MSVNLLRL